MTCDYTDAVKFDCLVKLIGLKSSRNGVVAPGQISATDYQLSYGGSVSDEWAAPSLKVMHEQFGKPKDCGAAGTLKVLVSAAC